MEENLDCRLIHSIGDGEGLGSLQFGNLSYLRILPKVP